MRVEFPYPSYAGIAPVDVPDRSLMGVWAPALAPDPRNEGEMLRDGFAWPLGAPRLRDAVRPDARIVILIDDGTRVTPIPKLLAHALVELSAAGVADDQVTLLTAPGTHREMHESEVKEKLGELFGRFALRQHRWREEAELHKFGRTRDGVRVTANRLLAESDFVLGLGSIVPHRVKGFSGGAKIAFPGVSGREMMEKNQWEASLRMSETVMGVPDNPMRLRMEEAARLASLTYIANVVLDRDGRIAGCFTGDLVAAHRAGCALSRRIYRADMPERADIVIIDAHPADRDFWQSAKALYAGTVAVKRGGTLIAVAPNPEGVADNHPDLLAIGYRPHAEIIAMVEAGGIDDLVGAAILADIAQIVDHADCVMVSPGMRREHCEKLGLRFAPTAQQALATAFERHGAGARVAVLRHGGHILPVVAESEPGSSPP